MMNYQSLTKLKKVLGETYGVCTLDFENCIYRDFGNGYNVQICCDDHSERKHSLTIFLWKGDSPNRCRIVKRIRGVHWDPAEIKAIVEELYRYSEEISKTHDNCFDIFRDACAVE